MRSSCSETDGPNVTGVAFLLPCALTLPLNLRAELTRSGDVWPVSVSSIVVEKKQLGNGGFSKSERINKKSSELSVYTPTQAEYRITSFYLL